MELIQHILSYDGLYACFDTSDADLFYKYVDKVINEDKLKHDNNHTICCKFFETYIRTSIDSMFMEILDNLLSSFKTSDIPRDSILNFISIEIYENETKNEIIISFDKEDSCLIKERKVIGEDHDHYSGMEGSNYRIYDPPYTEKESNIKEFKEAILNELKVLLGL